MASVTLTIEDYNDDIKVSISSSSPELPLRSDIKSTDQDLTPAQAAVFQMIELYMAANNIGEDDDESDASAGQGGGCGEKKKKCCGGKCRKPPPEGA